MGNYDLHAVLDCAVSAARTAGREIARAAQADGGPVLRMKDGVEPVTDSDLRSDRIIRGVLGSCIPSVPVLSEESGDLPVVGEGPLWIVDPIDGTANFARGHRYVAVSIAFAIDGVVQAGVVHAPLLDETFTAILGRGAALDGAPIGVTDRGSLADAIVSTGFPHVRPDIDALVERIRRLITHCQDIRRASSPALDLAWLAAGRLDAHTETLHPWDVAAGGLIATEAGAVRTLLPGPARTLPPDLDGAEVLFAVPGISDLLKHLLSE